MAKILIVNPNTTASMTKTIGEAARAVASPGTAIVDVTSAMGPVSIEGFYDEAFAVPGLIQALLNAYSPNGSRFHEAGRGSVHRRASNATRRTVRGTPTHRDRA